MRLEAIRNRLFPRRGVAAAIAALVVVAILPATSASVKPQAKKAAKQTDKQRELFLDFYPASPFFIVVKQPDGTAIRAKLNGAEIGGHLETPEGYTIVKGKNGWWYYADQAEGSVAHASSRRAGIDSTKGLKTGIGRVPSIWSGKAGTLRDQTFRALQVANYKAQQQAAISGTLPRVFKVPFIMLATWWDADAGQTEPQFQAGHDVEFFTKLLDGFGGNPTGTMTEFWLENSYGQLKVDVDVFGPYTSQRSRIDRCYYGNVEAEQQGETPNPLNSGELPFTADDDVELPITDEGLRVDYNGSPDDYLDPMTVGPIPRLDDLDPAGATLGVGGVGGIGMAIEAVPQADADINFADYDNDADGIADFVGFIHSGPDMAATGDPCHTWSHAIQVSLGLGPVGVPTTDIGATGTPVLVDRVFTMPEVNLDIGVAVHEMMHALGEPDYYNTSYQSMGTGDWDIMAGGSWFGNPPGSNPIGANPATKVFQGWVTPTVVQGDLRNYSLRPRELKPSPDYDVTKIDPGLLLVPIAWTDSTAPEDVYGLAKDPSNGKYITEGWYVENLSRSVSRPPENEQFKRSPYFDRLALSSGIMIWHFDYHKKSNVYYGTNDAQSDPQRPQMDPEEFDFNDNTQELQINLTRGEPSDLWFGAATGMTSATRQTPPGVPLTGTPDAPLSGSGVLPPGSTATYDFKVSDDPGNYLMHATVAGLGDCKLKLLHKEGNVWREYGSVDSGFVGDEEQLNVYSPPSGDWRLEVADFAACTLHDWAVTFSLPYLTSGAADTWTNGREDADGNPIAGSPTGWAITNIGPGRFEGWEHAADAGGVPAITVDVLNLDKNELDVSPGFATSPSGANYGRLPINVGVPTTIEVPVYNNGGKAVRDVTVTLKTAAGQQIGSKVISSIDGYAKAIATFSWTPGAEGPTDLIATVDPASSLTEVHEANNVQSTRLYVGPANPKVLVVDDDGSFDAEDTYLGTLTALGIPFAVAHGHADAATMKKFQAVIWQAGLERYQGQLDERDRAAIRTYLDGGGRLWYASPRAAAALGEASGSTNPGGGTDEMIGLLRDYFGATYVDTLQVGGGTVKGLGDAIGGSDSFEIDVFPGRPLQDQFDLAESTIGTATKVLDWSKGPAIGVKVQGDAKHGGFRSVYFGFNVSQALDGDAQAAITRQVMAWFGITPGSYKPSVPVIYHTQTRARIAAQATTVKAYVFGGSGTPTVYWRAHGTEEWQQLALTPGGTAGLYEGTIPGVWATLRGLDYFIQGAGTADPVTAPDVAHFIGVAPPELAPPAVAGVKITRGAVGGGAVGGRRLPATGIGYGLLGLGPVVMALAAGIWLRRRSA